MKKPYTLLFAIIVVTAIAFLVSKWQSTEHFAFLPPAGSKVTTAVSFNTAFKPAATPTKLCQAYTQKKGYFADSPPKYLSSKSGNGPDFCKNTCTADTNCGAYVQSGNYCMFYGPSDLGSRKFTNANVGSIYMMKAGQQPC